VSCLHYTSLQYYKGGVTAFPVLNEVPHLQDVKWNRDVVTRVFKLSRYSAGLRAGGSRVPFPAGAGNFSLHHRVQNGSGAHPASYPMDTRGSFPGGKAPGREADHSLPSSAEVK
jgi:hypothetical protein